ncbi:helix-turn-helix domain-containing protein [Nocardioides speluncae]|uniref:helix-turn-helix domain-containing protein n=1 Tax=Nocardioides speluncae TaxID=2670337 RepID=UPI000D692ECD|nr:helix-turn-helix transcriptional regulator [Nocardioides speluncae]
MHVGERIAARRRRQGMSQDALAGLVGRSRSWLSQVERGLRGVDRLSTLRDLAVALRCEVADLIDSERLITPTGSSRMKALDALRSQLSAYGEMFAEPSTPWPLPQLRNAVVLVNHEYQAARYERAAAMLPEILGAADAYYDGSAGRAGRGVHLARCMAYVVTAKLLTKVGEAHLAWLAADRATHAAVAAESTAAEGMAAYQVACALLLVDGADAAELLAVRAAEGLMTDATSDSPDLVSLSGALWLLAAVIAARRSDRPIAIERLVHAERLGELLGRDANHAWTAFGPTNVAVHRASSHAELGDPRAVLRAAADIDPESFPVGLNGRRSRIYLDLAWAQTQARNDLEAILHLKRAESVAPEVLRFDSVAQGLVRDLLKRARRPSAALTTMATRAGILN